MTHEIFYDRKDLVKRILKVTRTDGKKLTQKDRKLVDKTIELSDGYCSTVGVRLDRGGMSMWLAWPHDTNCEKCSTLLRQHEDRFTVADEPVVPGDYIMSHNQRIIVNYEVQLACCRETNQEV